MGMHVDGTTLCVVGCSVMLASEWSTLIGASVVGSARLWYNGGMLGSTVLWCPACGKRLLHRGASPVRVWGSGMIWRMLLGAITSEWLSGLAEMFMRPWDDPCLIVSKKRGGAKKLLHFLLGQSIRFAG